MSRRLWVSEIQKRISEPAILRTVHIVIDSTGKAGPAYVLDTLRPRDIFTDELREVFNSLTWIPATREGKPVKSELKIPVLFYLAGSGLGREIAKPVLVGDKYAPIVNAIGR